MGTYTATRLILSLALTSTLLAACGYGSSGTPSGTGNATGNATGTGGHITATAGTSGTGTGGTSTGAAVRRERTPRAEAATGPWRGPAATSSTGTGGGQAGTGGSSPRGPGAAPRARHHREGGHHRERRHHREPRRHHRQRRQHRPFGLGDAGFGRSIGDRSHGHGYRQHRHHGRGDRPQVHGIQLRKDPHHERLAEQLQQEVDRAVQAAWHPDRQAGRQRRGSVELWRNRKRSVESAGAALHPHRRQRDDRPVLRLPAGDGVAVHLRRQLPVRQRLGVDGRGDVRHESAAPASGASSSATKSTSTVPGPARSKSGRLWARP